MQLYSLLRSSFSPQHSIPVPPVLLSAHQKSLELKAFSRAAELTELPTPIPEHSDRRISRIQQEKFPKARTGKGKAGVKFYVRQRGGKAGTVGTTSVGPAAHKSCQPTRPAPGLAPPSPLRPLPPSCPPGASLPRLHACSAPRQGGGGGLCAPTHPRVGWALRPHTLLQPRGGRRRVPGEKRGSPPPASSAVAGRYFPRRWGETRPAEAVCSREEMGNTGCGAESGTAHAHAAGLVLAPFSTNFPVFAKIIQTLRGRCYCYHHAPLTPNEPSAPPPPHTRPAPPAGTPPLPNASNRHTAGLPPPAVPRRPALCHLPKPGSARNFPPPPSPRRRVSPARPWAGPGRGG